MADLAAVQTKLETFDGLTARLEQHRVAMGVAVEFLQGRLLDGWTAAAVGAGMAAGGAEEVQAWRTGLQQTQEKQRAVAWQASQQQLQTRVCGGKK